LAQYIHQPLEFLIYTTIILFIITGGFLIKLLIDLSGLVGTMQIFVKSMQTELEPTIKEIKATLENINTIAANVSNNIDNLNKGVQKSTKAASETVAVISQRAFEAGKIIAKTIIRPGFGLLWDVLKRKVR
jgi:methyl-accepting chemotaxis protein